MYFLLCSVCETGPILYSNRTAVYLYSFFLAVALRSNAGPGLLILEVF